MIAIASDHGGFDLKQVFIEYLEKKGLSCKDYGTYDKTSCSYPVYAMKLCDGMKTDGCDLGILICGTGIGMSIAANRHAHIRAALCNDSFSAKMAREHNNANVLVLGARVIGEELALHILDTFLDTHFSNEVRHLNRINMF